MRKLTTKGKNASPLDEYWKRKSTTMDQNSSKPAYVPEDLRNWNFRTDSPTSSSEGLCTACCLISSNHWILKSLGIKAAFLQGKKIDRTLYVRPPKEANTNKIWKLRKCVYGLVGASRYWYLKPREELIKLGTKPCQLDQGIFVWYKNNMAIGIMVCFVDDWL